MYTVVSHIGRHSWSAGLVFTPQCLLSLCVEGKLMIETASVQEFPKYPPPQPPISAPCTH